MPLLPERVLFVRRLRRFIPALTAVLAAFSLLTIQLFHASTAHAAAANTVNFQARLQTASGAVVPDGFYNVEFKLYSASSGGSALWTEDYLNSSSQGLKTINGYLTANLGSITSFPSTINWDQQLWLTMNIGGTTTGSVTWDGEMSPRLTLTAVPFALSAGQLSTTSGSGHSTLTIQGSTSGNQNFVIQDQGAAGTYNLLTTNQANAGYIQLQGSTPGTAQTGNFNISGTGVAGVLQGSTAIKTPAIRPVTDGTSALQIENAAGTVTVLDVDTTNARIGIGTTAPGASLSIKGATADSSTIALDVESSAGGALITARNDGQVSIGTTAASGTSTTFGSMANTTPDTSGGDSNYFTATKFTTGSNPGTLTSISIYVNAIDPTAANDKFRLAIYADGGSNHPTTLIAQSAEGSLSANTFNTLPVSASLSANTTYWLAYQTNGTSIPYNDFSYASGATNQYYSYSNPYGPFPSTAGTGGANGAVAQAIYGTYTEAGTSTTPAVVVASNGNVGIGGVTTPSTALQVQGTVAASALSLTGNGTATAFQAGLFDTASGSTLNLGTSTATSVNIGNSSLISTVTIGNGSTGGTLINYSSTLNPAAALGNFTSNGAIGTAATTVDIHTSFTINQTTSSITLTIPSPTVTTAGRIIYIANIGTATTTVGGVTMGAGTSASFFWNGSAWISASVSTGASIVGTYSSSSIANGASISGNTLTLGVADGTNPGMVSTTTQTFAGDKTLTGNTTMTGTATVAKTSTTAFQIQNTGGGSTLLTADTSNMKLGIGTAAPGATVDVKGATSDATASALNVQNSAGGSVLKARNDGQVTIGTIASSGTSTTFGSNTHTTADTNDSLSLSASKFTTGSTAGTLTSISIWVNGIDPTAANDKYRLAIYSDAGADQPQTLIAESAEGTLTANAFNTLTVNASLSANTTYWLAYQTNGSSSTYNNFSYASGSTKQLYYKAQSYGSFPGTAPSGGSNGNVAMAIYGTYTLAGTANVSALTVAASGNIGIGNTSPAYALDLVGTGNFSTSVYAPSLDTATAGTLSLGTASATTITIGSSTSVTSVNGGFRINGAATFGTLALGNFSGGGSIGSAATTVDLYASISVAQTSGSQTLTVPNPTASTTYGKLLYLSNVGTQSFTLLGTPLKPGATATLIWSNTNGGASWQYAGSDGNSILNQSASTQTADFKINGTGTAATFTASTLSAPNSLSIQAGSGNNDITATAAGTGTVKLETGSAGGSIVLGSSNLTRTISIGSTGTQAQTVTIGSNGSTSGTLTLDAGTGATAIQIGNSNSNHGIKIGTGTGVQTVTLGSGNSSSATTIQGGTGGIMLQTGTAASGNSGAILIQSGNASSGTAGNVSIDVGAGTVATGSSVENDTFESGVNSWASWYSTGAVSSSTAQAHGGTHSLAFTTTNTWGVAPTYPGVAAAASTTYTFTAWVRSGVSEKITLSASWITPGAVQVAAVTVAANTWTKITGSLVAPVGTTNVYPTIEGDGSTGHTVYVDDVTVSTAAASPVLALGTANAAAVLIGNLNQAGTTTIQGGASGVSLAATSTTALVVQDSSGNSYFTVDTSNKKVTAGSSGQFSVDSSGNMSTTGTGTVQTSSTAAFQIQNSSGTNILTADTTNAQINALGLNVGGTAMISATGNLLNDGFENNSFAKWAAGSAGSPTISTSIVRNGRYAANFSGTAQNEKASVTANSTVYARAYVYFASQTTSSASFLWLASSAGTSYFQVYRQTDGTICLQDTSFGTSGAVGSCSGSLTLSAWHEVELRITTSTSVGQAQLWLDGTQIVSTAANQNYSSTTIAQTWIGTGGGETANLYVDDVSVGTTDPGASADSLHVTGTSTLAGNTLVQAAANSTTSFQVQNSSGTSVLTADTVNMRIDIKGGQSTATLGSNLLTNGNFATNSCSSWTCGSGWAATTGAAVHTTGNTAALTQTITVTAGTTYQIDFTQTGSTAGSLNFSLGANADTWQNWDSNTHRTLVAPSSGSLTFTITPTTDFNGTVDNFSVAAITGTSIAVQRVLNSDGTVGLEMRSGGSAANNSYVGTSAGQNTTTGSYNAALGTGALQSNTTGSYNAAVGSAALQGNTTGSWNTAVGQASLYSNTVGTSNVAIGQDALYSNVNGNTNTVIGASAGYLNVSGYGNIFIGATAGFNETGNNKLYIANSSTSTPLIGGDFSGAQSLNINGNATFMPTSGNDSSSAFKIQSSTSVSLFAVDSSAKRITIGTAGSSPTLLVFANKTDNTSDPTGVEGGMYYNAVSHSFRCYINSFWQDCATGEIDYSYNLTDDFFGGASCSNAACTSSASLGAMGWGATLVNGASNGTVNGRETTNASATHPGVLSLQTGTTSGVGLAINMSASYGLAVGQDYKSTIAVSNAGSARMLAGLFLINGSIDYTSTAPIYGVYWRAGATNWEYCYGNGSTGTCTSTGVAVAANTWARTEIRINALGSGTSNVDFVLNGTTYNVSGVTVSDNSGGLSPNVACATNTSSARTCYIDYYQMRGYASSAR